MVNIVLQGPGDIAGNKQHFPLGELAESSSRILVLSFRSLRNVPPTFSVDEDFVLDGMHKEQ
jgi:hypothetical protein